MDNSNKGNFEEMSESKYNDINGVLESISIFQKKYNYTDADDMLDNVRDYKVGKILGYPYVNMDKHGWDCSDNKGRFLENKKISISSRTWVAVFNDTSEEKAMSFKKDNVTISASVFNNIFDVSFIVYGSNKEIGDYLMKRIHERKAGSRSTQSISVVDLLRKYGFKIKCVSASKEKVKELFKKKYKRFNIVDSYFD